MHCNVGEGNQQRVYVHFSSLVFFSSFSSSFSDSGNKGSLSTHIKILICLLNLSQKRILSLKSRVENLISHFHIQPVVTRFLNYKRIYFSFAINYRLLSSTHLVFEFCLCCTCCPKSFQSRTPVVPPRDPHIVMDSHHMAEPTDYVYIVMHPPI